MITRTNYLAFVSVILSLLATGQGTQATTVELEDVQVNLINKLQIPVREAGVVEEVLVEVGDLVQENDVLVRMDDRIVRLEKEAAELQARLAELESQNDVDFRFAEKSRAVAEAEQQRGQQAVESYAKSVSKSELDQLKLVAERAALAAEQAQRDLDGKQLTLQLREKELELLAARVEMMQVRAPSSGMVVEVFPQDGEWVASGAPIARLIRLDRLRVEGFVDGKRFDQSLKGAAVSLLVKLPPGNQLTEFFGSVSFVSPEVNPVTGQIRVFADIDNPELKLRPGTRGKLVITIDDGSTTQPEPLEAPVSEQ